MELVIVYMYVVYNFIWFACRFEWTVKNRSQVEVKKFSYTWLRNATKETIVNYLNNMQLRVSS